MSGWIEVVAGSMYSGKTEELIRRVRRAQYAKLKVQVFKPIIDQRYHQTNVTSHNQNQVEAIPLEITLMTTLKLLDLTKANFLRWV